MNVGSGNSNVVMRTFCVPDFYSKICGITCPLQVTQTILSNNLRIARRRSKLVWLLRIPAYDCMECRQNRTELTQPLEGRTLTLRARISSISVRTLTGKAGECYDGPKGCMVTSPILSMIGRANGKPVEGKRDLDGCVLSAFNKTV